MCNHFEINSLIRIILSFVRVIRDIVQYWSIIDIKLLIFVEEVLCSPTLLILPTWNDKWHVIIFNIMEDLKHAFEYFRPLFFDEELVWLNKQSLCVTYATGSWSISKLCMNSIPSLFKDLLHLL